MKSLLGIILLTLTLEAKSEINLNVPQLPDSVKTPGAVLTTDLEKICVVGYTKTVRDVSERLKNEIYDEYGIYSHEPKEFEIDHLISLELGGSNEKTNLWAQSYKTSPYNATLKDVLEHKMHRLVCSHQLDIKQAQKEISTNWIEAYHKYVGK